MSNYDPTDIRSQERAKADTGRQNALTDLMQSVGA